MRTSPNTMQQPPYYFLLPTSYFLLPVFHFSLSVVARTHTRSVPKQIAEAYRRYGITSSSRDIIVVKVLISSGEEQGGEDRPGDGAPTAQGVEAHLRQHVEGTSVPFSDEVLAQTTDWVKVRKYYKLNGISWIDAIKDESLRRREMELLVLGSMALRGL